jgi:hypothetical protein
MKFSKCTLSRSVCGSSMCADLHLSPGRGGAKRAQPEIIAGAITINVVVTDKSGAPVADLQPGDFKLLLDKKHPQDIVSVKAFSGSGRCGHFAG